MNFVSYSYYIYFMYVSQGHMTPLNIARIHGHDKVVEVLLRSGAKVSHHLAM